ncbi:hypothetical protein [Sphingomonas montanisoli]|uniref:Tetratricopeptide repeat protein n=1 Tax=Sphingomonas montanisoli TaxID=2606412 RepID=A0A5D9CDF1_9SPHN|nr:hypothetical protein [Sphingomonas montanisoli]TZG29050.1 hypothetical protein FYJ91_02620 [Sphingomonas montanisoli]
MAGPREIDPIEAAALRDELALLLASPAFSRAPIMKRLLEYLVAETLAGRGEQLKAYSVAVDGLGRAPDYDARADSYPRVQIGRLRRLIIEHYAQTAPGPAGRLSIPQGRYRVELDRGTAPIEPEAPTAPIPVAPARKPVLLWVAIAAAFFIVIAITAVVALVILPRHEEVTTGSSRPMLEIAAANAKTPDSDLSDQVRAVLLDGLRRSAVFDVRTTRSVLPPDPKATEARYRLAVDIPPGDAPRVTLRLWRLSPDRLLWSGSYSLPSADVRQIDIVQRLGPAIALISRADGLVAAQEYASAPAGPYRCMLTYHRYRRERTDADRGELEHCVPKSIAQADSPLLQATASYLALDRLSGSRGASHRKALLMEAQTHAQLATTIDPTDPWAVSAQARVASVQKACPRAIRNAIASADLAPYEPVVLADAGVILLNCHDARAEKLIRDAITIDAGPDGRFYWALVLVAIDRGDRALAAEALDRMTPPVIGRRPRYHLITAAGYAMLGDNARATAAWDQLKAADPGVAANPAQYLERTGISREIAARVIADLRKIGLASG